ncbi:hypothetical protein Tco_0020134 [Tanacetum coccineum]
MVAYCGLLRFLCEHRLRLWDNRRCLDLEQMNDSINSLVIFHVLDEVSEGSLVGRVSIYTQQSQQLWIKNPGTGQRNDKSEEQSLHQQRSRKDYRSGDLFRKHPSETKVFTMKMEILLEPTSNKLLVGSFKDGDGDGDTQSHKGVKASANSDIVYFFTSAQDGNTLQDDERLDLADDLMKAQVHNQRQVNDESKDLCHKRTRY